MKIAIGVHGRFHAFHLAKALLEAGQDVAVFTNYPRSVAARWELPPKRVRSFVSHGLLARATLPLRRMHPGFFDLIMQRSFGRWLSRRVAVEDWEVIHLWSGVGEETLLRRPRPAKAMFVMRGSAHIRVQDRLLREEEARLGLRLERPSRWAIAREEREYEAADRIVVLSSFAESSFLAHGVSTPRVARLPLAAPVERYRASDLTLRARVDRLRSGHPIRALFVGALSAQKGLYDLVRTIRLLPVDRFTWRLVGPRVAETGALLRTLPDSVEVLGKRPESELPEHYGWADAFVFPSLQDGYAVVLAQASAAGLPIVATTNCGAADLVQEGRTGWVVPIRSPTALAGRLLWLDAHRSQAITMVDACSAAASDRPWSAVAREFVTLCATQVGDRAGRPGGRNAG